MAAFDFCVCGADLLAAGERFFLFRNRIIYRLFQTKRAEFDANFHLRTDSRWEPNVLS